MTSTASTSLRLELMATGDQSGTWGDTTNTNLGTLLEQAITGVASIAEGDTTLTLTNTDYVSNQARNAVINLTGAMTAARNVIVPTANKLYFIKNSTTGGFTVTVKTTAGTGIAIPASTGRWVYCDGTNVVDMYSGDFTPSTNDGAALGTTAVAWSDLFLASGGVINFNAGGVLIRQAAGFLVFTGAASGYTFDARIMPAANDGAPLGDATISWSDLFLASGGVLNWNNGDVLVTHSTNLLAFSGASSGYTFDNTVRPPGNDVAALGSSTVSWSDLFLASGGVINFANGNVTVTHSTDTLTFANAANGYFFDTSLDVAAFSLTGASNGKHLTSTAISSSRSVTTSATHAQWINPNGIVGSITTSASATAYATTSDETLKDFIGEYDPLKAIEIIKADPVRDFNWKATGAPAVGWGAQTSFAVSEDLATPGGWFDEETGEPRKKGAKGAVYHPWGVDQSKRTPYLWAALSWTLDRIQDLEERLARLETAAA